MKYFFHLLVAMIFFNASEAQVVNVPVKAKDHLSRTYPKALKLEWKNNVTNYEAIFEQGRSKYISHYNIDGNWTFTEKVMTYDELPKEVQDAHMKSKYAEWEIITVSDIENSKNEKSYRIEVKKSIEKKYIFMDSEGKYIKESRTL
jgi:Putative beta-lactamase-inhibitor-like, PepSY-like